jgi:hypothetical protein
MSKRIIEDTDELQLLPNGRLENLNSLVIRLADFPSRVQNVTGARALDVVYQNTTTGVMIVQVSVKLQG